MDNIKVQDTVLDLSKDIIGETVLEENEHIGETVLEDIEKVQETVLDINSSTVDKNRTILNPGQTIASSYVVVKRIGDIGSQAVVYVARREGRLCAIKLYNTGYKPSLDLINQLKDNPCPYVAELYDYGFEDDNYYEIYKYYGNGTLEDKGRCTPSFIKDIVVPNLNEGLKFLHSIGGVGIVHGDIKPSNIFISEGEDRVIIGDFGISSYLNKNGKNIDGIKGTPEYSPRTVGFFGKSIKSNKFDYGSLGLVLIKLATGHSLFEGLDIMEITKAWEEGLKIPEAIDSRLARLIQGLLNEDEDKRFGYEEVKKWCEGQYVKVIEKNLYTEDDFNDNKEKEPLIFGIFDNKVLVVSTLKELFKAIVENWEHAKKQITREVFFDFIGQFDEGLEKEIRQCCSNEDKDIAIFHIIYKLEQNPNIFFKGVNYGTDEDFVSSLNEKINEDQKKIIKAGLFEYFLKSNGCGDNINNIVNKEALGDGISTEFLAQVFYYIFNEDKEYILNGTKISSNHDLINKIVELTIDDIEKLAIDNKFLAWLYSIGYEDEVINFFNL